MPATQPTKTVNLPPVAPLETLGEEIKAISEGVKKLLAGPIKRRTVIMLIRDAAPGSLSHKQVETVLAGIENLNTHLKN